MRETIVVKLSGDGGTMSFRFAKAIVLVVFLTAIPIRLAVAQETPSTAATPDEAATERESESVRAIEGNLVAEKFDDLDRMADQYRRDKTRLPGGNWRLAELYSALDAPRQTDKDTADHLAHLEHWMQQRPESITARVAVATSLTRWAWVARGNGGADTVTPAGWTQFNERIKQAQTVLEGAANLKTMCPQWYSEMMTVGLAQGWDANRVRENFERGIQFEPQYFYLYRQYATYLLPKWYGKPGDSSAFAKSSADRLGGEAGDLLYFQIAGILIKRGDGSFPVEEMDWQRIQRGYQAVSTQYGLSRRTKNELAYMAYKYQDETVARQQFAEIGDDWSRGVWRDRSLFDRARDWSSGHGQL